jgi:hypothetical protein
VDHFARSVVKRVFAGDVGEDNGADYAQIRG